MNYDELGEHLNKHHLASCANLVPKSEKSLLRLRLTYLISGKIFLCAAATMCLCGSSSAVPLSPRSSCGGENGFSKDQNRQHLENTNARGGYSLDLEISSILNQNRLFRDGRCHAGYSSNKNSRIQEESE